MRLIQNLLTVALTEHKFLGLFNSLVFLASVLYYLQISEVAVKQLYKLIGSIIVKCQNDTGNTVIEQVHNSKHNYAQAYARAHTLARMGTLDRV